MAAHTQIVYIYIEGFDLPQRGIAQRNKHEAKNREFIAVKYTQDGKFEPELPLIDAGTKVIIDGHSSPMADNLSQRPDGGTLLDYEIIADELAKKVPVGKSVQIALYGCEVGVGLNRVSHDDSFAAKLFRALVKRNLKPTISAGLSLVSMETTGKLSRAIIIKKSPMLFADYHKLAAKIYENDSDKRRGLEEFQHLQENRENIFDSQAQGSMVELTYEENNPMQPNITYPYGKPNDKFEAGKLNSNEGTRGKRGVRYLLGREILFAQNFKDKMEESRAELRRIFEIFEKENPAMLQTEQYSELKHFLVTEDYFIDVEIISQFILNKSSLSEGDCKVLIGKIKKNAVLNGFQIDSNDYNFNLQSALNTDSGYLQLGLDIMRCKIASDLNPILIEAFSFLDGPTQQKLAVELGKQMVGDAFDADFVKQCIDRANHVRELYHWGMNHIQQVGADLNNIPVDRRLQFVLELGKKQQGLAYDETFIQQYTRLTTAQIAAKGRHFITTNGDERILAEQFYRLSPEQQGDLAFLVGQERFCGPLSEGDQTSMMVLFQIAQELPAQNNILTVSQPAEAKKSPSFLSAFFPPPGKEKQESPQKQDNSQLSCTIS